jgi:hypothetical protein
MHLIYLIALDTPEAGGNRLMAKMLAMSLIRSQFDGDILIFRSSAVPIFHLPRPGIVEVQLPNTAEGRGGQSLAQEAWSWKYRVAGAVAEHAAAIGAEKILYLDSDILCLKNPDHLLDGVWDIGIVPERGRSFSEVFYSAYLSDGELARLSGKPPLNAGTFAVRRESYTDVMAAWAAIHEGPPPERNKAPCDQCAWNRMILDTTLKVHAIEPEAVMFPLNRDFDYRRYRDSMRFQADALLAKIDAGIDALLALDADAPVRTGGAWQRTRSSS